MHTSATSHLIPTMLKEYGDVTRNALSKFLPDREPRRYLYDLVSDYPNRHGKMMRPGLCIATARAFGARLEDAVSSAVSIELLHNALLIHDDIQDESEVRRGDQTLHKKHGVPLAMNAGDVLSLLSISPLMENFNKLGSELSMKIVEESQNMALETAEGQALELGWRRDNIFELGDADYLVMVLKKTCWLATIHPVRVGALIGTDGNVDTDQFIRFGFFLGAAFQIQDDLLNLIGDQRYGKELDGDICEGKRTIMLLRLFHLANDEQKARLMNILQQSRDNKGVDEVRWIRSLMDEYECIDYARQVAHGLAGAAAHEFTLLYSGLPDSRDKQFIDGLVTWVFERT